MRACIAVLKDNMSAHCWKSSIKYTSFSSGTLLGIDTRNVFLLITPGFVEKTENDERIVFFLLNL